MADNWNRIDRPGENEEDDLEVRPGRVPGGSQPASRYVIDSVPRAQESLPRPSGYWAPPAADTPGAPVPPPLLARRPGQRTGNGCIWILALVAVVVLACGVVGVGAARSGFDGLSGWLPRFPGLPLITPTVIIQAQGPSVIQQIQTLSRLETARYTIEKVETGESTGVLPPFTSDKILFIAHGDVTAGVDLGKLSDADVQVVSNTVTMRLPVAEILGSRLDNDKSRVYDRQTGVFTKADPNLESQIRQRAEQDIVEAAKEDGILDKAQANAEATLRTLLHGLHYDSVTFLPPLPTPPTAGPATAGPDATAPADPTTSPGPK